jgi:hypothetical protein
MMDLPMPASSPVKQVRPRQMRQAL